MRFRTFAIPAALIAFASFGACAGSSSTEMRGICTPPPRSVEAIVSLEDAFGGQTFSQPIEMTAGPGGRFYVLEQAGRVRVVSTTGGAASTALDISSKIVSGGESGLLGIAFDPRFEENGSVYLHYNASLEKKAGTAFQSVIARFKSKDRGATIDPESGETLLVVDQPFANHNGGKIVFGPDGKLYVAFGDGGSRGDPFGNAQRKDVLLGKILRVDVSGEALTIPPDNPFVSDPKARGEIWAYGLRNPWKMSFDSATGDLWAGDVGQNRFEEIDLIVGGGNYGWKIREGAHCYEAESCQTEGLIDPVVDYDRTEGITVVAGSVYRGAKIPSLLGKLVFGDFGTGTIWATERGAGGKGVLLRVAASGMQISTFGAGADGEIYVADYVSGRVKKLVPRAAEVDVAGPRPTILETGCVDGVVTSRKPVGLFAYDVASPLWSDGAAKSRWFYVPSGKTIGVGADGDLDLPPGSATVKTFTIDGRKIETRLFARYDDGVWAGYSYEWNDEETNATLLTGGKTKVLPSGQTWTFPSRAECFACHTAAAGFTLGLEARQLDDATLTRLAPLLDRPIAREDFPMLAHLGPRADAAPPLTTSAANEERAKSYLHANCSMCHRPGTGIAASAMDLRFESGFRICNAEPQAGDLGVPGARILVPGDPARSILALRMRRRGESEPGQMPPLATRIVDVEGLASIEAWIAASPPCP